MYGVVRYGLLEGRGEGRLFCKPAKYEGCKRQASGRAKRWQGLSGRRASSLGFHVMRNTASSHILLIWTQCIDRENLELSPLAFTSFPSLAFASCNPSPHPYAPLPCYSLLFLLNAESRDSRLTAAPTPSRPPGDETVKYRVTHKHLRMLSQYLPLQR